MTKYENIMNWVITGMFGLLILGCFIEAVLF
jgi:hypothetical protein